MHTISSRTTIDRSTPLTVEFTTAQSAAMLYGQSIADDLKYRVQVALGRGNLTVEPFRHYYIGSRAGGGKTFQVRDLAKELGIEMCVVQGASSISALVRQLALAAFYNQEKEITVLIDDCDIMFTNIEGQEVMKGALDGDQNVIAWNKVMSQQIKSLEASTVEQDHRMAEALRFYSPANQTGIVIPTDNMRFLVLSNHSLFPSRGVHNGSPRKINQGAIRDRFGNNYRYYDLTPEENWGWVAHILLTNEFASLPGLTLEQKYKVLNWVWDKLEVLEEMSLRSVQGLAAQLVNHPNDYRNRWDSTVPNKRQIKV